MTPDWHLDEQLALRYSTGAVDTVLAASVEQHLMRCPGCRDLVVADVPRLDRVWTEVLERVQAPEPTWLERLLHRLGVDRSTARLVAVTPSLRGSWLTGVVVVLALATAVAHQGPAGVALFLALAPVLPVVGVAFAFGPAADPAHELVASTPYSSVRLLAVRTAVVVTSTLLPALLTGLLLPGSGWVPFAWLTPALALTVGTLALGTRFPPLHAAVGLAAVWVSLLAPTLLREDRRLLATELPVQLTCLVVLVAALATLVARRRDLPELLRRNA